MRKSIRVGLVAGLVATGLVGVTSLTASGSGDRPMIAYGTLTLTLTDRAGSLTLDRVDGARFTQALGVSTPCSTLIADDILDSATPPNVVEDTLNLLNFGAAVSGGFAPNVQLPSNGIGVTDGANCGEPSGLVGPGETLTLELGGFLPDEVRISTASLQIGKSRGNDGNLLVAYDGAFGPTPIGVAVGGQAITVTDADSKFESISIRSTASQSSRGLSLRSNTILTLVAPAPATAPGVPTNLSAERGNGQATVTWDAPLDDGGSEVTGYELRYLPSGGDWTEWATATSGDPVTGLANGTLYTFEVRAVNDVGEGPAASTTATPASAPGAPTGVTVVGGAVKTTVSWTAPTDDGGLPPVTYELQYTSDTSATPTSVTVVPATATTQDVTDLAPGTYVFEVRAVTEAGQSNFVPSDPVTIVALPVDCGGTVVANGETGDIATKVTFLRGENQDKPGENVAGECLEVDATVKIVSGDTDAPQASDYVFWDNTFEDINGDIQRVNATVTIDWAPVAPADAALLDRFIDYDGPTGAGPYRETLWCESFEQTEDDPVTYAAILPDWTYPAETGTQGSIIVIEDGPDGPIEVRKAPWCLVSDTRVQQGGQIFQTEILFGSGDPSRTSSFR
jgi:hypothetical protein